MYCSNCLLTIFIWFLSGADPVIVRDDITRNEAVISLVGSSLVTQRLNNAEVRTEASDGFHLISYSLQAMHFYAVILPLLQCGWHHFSQQIGAFLLSQYRERTQVMNVNSEWVKRPKYLNHRCSICDIILPLKLTYYHIKKLFSINYNINTNVSFRWYDMYYILYFAIVTVNGLI